MMTGASETKHDLREARKVVNRITLNRVASEVDADPAADLTDLLATQLKIYPGFVETFAQSVRARSPERKDGGGTRGSDDSQEPPPAAESLSVSAELPIKIVYPLTPHLLAFIHEGEAIRAADNSSGSPPRELVAALNRQMAEAERLHELHNNFVLGLGPSVAAKVGPFLDVDHLSNLQYVNSRVPDIPTPQCLGAFRDSHQSYFFLSRAPGVTLESAWPDLTTSHKLSIQSQLNKIFKALRAQAPDGEGDQFRLGSFETGICKDTRRMQRVSEEPIRTEAEFNDFLCYIPGRTATPWIKMIRSGLREDHRIVLTHGDLHPRNIMVSWEGDQEAAEGLRITAILDWELAGWYPEHWEFVKALNTVGTRGPLRDWIDFLPTDAIGSYLVEYSIDCVLDRWLG